MTADRHTVTSHDVTPMADIMAQLAAGLGVEIVRTDDRQPTPDELRSLPPTEWLEREVTRCQRNLDAWGAGRTSGLGFEHRRQMLAVAERQVRWGWVRDAIVARFTDDCACYGDGKILVPAVFNTEGGEEIEPRFWRYCPCQAGDALRASYGKAQRIAEESRSHDLAHAIFEQGGDDFTEYIDATLDTYRDRLDGYQSSVQMAGRTRVADLYLWIGTKGAPWLVLTGPTGTGKTGLAVSVLRVLASQGVRGLIVREKSMLDRIRATYNRQRQSDEPTESDVLEILRRVPVLAIDDVAAPGSTTTDWAQGQLFDVLNARYSARRRTILTSNLDSAGDDLAAYLGPRIWSRLHERTAGDRWLFQVSEPDLRQTGVWH